MTQENKFKQYGKSKQGNFEVIDTIGVPHAYCITPKHMKYANMYLGEAEILEAERHEVYCDICVHAHRKEGKPILTYKQHEQALLIACYKDFKEPVYEQELRAYLLENKGLCESENYSGFAFIAKFKTPKARTKKGGGV